MPTTPTELENRIQIIENQLRKRFREWTDDEKEEYGNHEQLRRKEDQLNERLNILLGKQQPQQAAPMEVDRPRATRNVWFKFGNTCGKIDLNDTQVVYDIKKAAAVEISITEQSQVSALKLILTAADGTALDDDANIASLGDIGKTKPNAIVVTIDRNEVPMEIDKKQVAFDGNSYELDFPFFQGNGETYLPVIAREGQFKKINKIVTDRYSAPKYQPIIVSGSRGIGKTFMLKKIGMQDHPHNLDILVNSKECGRVVSFDCSKMTFAKKAYESNAMEIDVINMFPSLDEFFPCLLIFFLCRMFDGCTVDGKLFQKTKSVYTVLSHQGRQEKFNDWIDEWRKKSVDDCIEEYIRLTNLAFDKQFTANDAPLVFLLDEVQQWTHVTHFVSKADGYHTIISKLLTLLAKSRPVCVCSGTSIGKIFEITDKSAIKPISVDLEIFSKKEDYERFWKELTDHALKNYPGSIEYSLDDADVLALIYDSYQVPRLLAIAHEEWIDGKKKETKKELVLQIFEQCARGYYSEMSKLLINQNYSVEMLANLILHCSVYFQLPKYDLVPYSNDGLCWADLIHKSIIFPYTDGSYIIPFNFIWKSSRGLEQGQFTEAEVVEFDNRKKQIVAYIQEQIPGLNLEYLFFESQSYYNYSINELGLAFERLVLGSMAVRSYLFGQPVTLATLFDLKNETLETWIVEIKGISCPDTEHFATEIFQLPGPIIHNVKTGSAHHDAFINAQWTCLGKILLAQAGVQFKCSVKIPSKDDVLKQMIVSKQQEDELELLLWIYLNEDDYVPSNDIIEQLINEQNRVVFIYPSGCCNGLALNLLELLKRVKKRENE